LNSASGSFFGHPRGLPGGVVVLVMFIACALFWSGFEQAGSSMDLFAKRHVDRFIGGFEVPAGWFQSVLPAFVILLAPVFQLAPALPSLPLHRIFAETAALAHLGANT
jgi:hypothetical protein